MSHRAAYQHLILSAILCFSSAGCYGQRQVLDSTLHHLRNSETREWSEFSHQADKELLLHFNSQPNSAEQTLILRQYDVKQNWSVIVNGKEVGVLVSDEKDITSYFSIPAGTIGHGKNVLQVKCMSTVADDIKVGEFTLDRRPLNDVLTETTVDIAIVERGTQALLPARITVVNEKKSLQTVTAFPEEDLAIRPGYAYTANGKLSLRLPAGRYTLYAGRGFEYSVDSIKLTLKAGDHIQKTFMIKREVDTDGWISSDTHIHTVTHSGHGDATEEERAITIAGEGIELPIMTDHNVYVDLTSAARKTGVDNYFTPVVGDELTTKMGHFNVFETTVGVPVIDHQAEDWNDVRENINDTEENKVIILNHARDIHNGFRPFDPTRHLSSAGVSKDDWKFPANAMEVINSGSQQTDIMTLYHDWFGMLNRGHFLTPVGSSDSHDVSRYMVGQGRTYIRGEDTDPANISIDEAIKNFRDGKVMVSSGLLTKITVNTMYGPGETVPSSRELNIAVEVTGPSWTKADRVSLYANGKKIREATISPTRGAVTKWESAWKITVPKHDIFLVAIAEGPGEAMPYWPIAKPYQPSSIDWQPRIIGSSGAVWIDADGNGQRNSAYHYAAEIINSSGNDIDKIIKRLASYDQAVAMQVAALWWKKGIDLTSHEVTEAMKLAAPATKAGFKTIIDETALLRGK